MSRDTVSVLEAIDRQDSRGLKARYSIAPCRAGAPWMRLFGQEVALPGRANLPGQQART